MTGTKRGVMQDRVPQARIYMVWNTPQWGAIDSTLLDIASDVLAAGKTSRLYKRLVYDDQIATDVDRLPGRERDRQQLRHRRHRQAGRRPRRRSRRRSTRSSPASSPAARPPTSWRGSRPQIPRGVHPRHRADRRLRRQVRHPRLQRRSTAATPASTRSRMAQRDAATAEAVRKAAADWLSDGIYVLEVHPFPQLDGGDDRRRPLQAPRPRPAPHRHAARHRARHAVERPQARRRPPRRRAGRQPRPARRRRLRGRRRRARHRQRWP